jgi:hypothetical protein
VKLFRLLIVILVLSVLMIQPVAAQEVFSDKGPEVVDTVSDSDIDLDLVYTVLVLMSALCICLFTLAGGAVFGLYKSQPQWGQVVTKELFDNVLAGMMKLAEMTPSTLDDRLLSEVADLIDTELYGGGASGVAARASPTGAPLDNEQ